MPLLKALIVNTEETPPIPIPVMFNPPQYQLKKSNNYAKVEKPLSNECEYQFLSGDAQELSLELFFDTTDLGIDVRAFTNAIYQLVKVPEGKKQPPVILFLWGPFMFECRITTVSHRFEYFDSAGQALRAWMNVTLVGMDLLQDKVTLGNSTAAKAGSMVVKMGQSIHGIASSVLGDSKQWRTIAKENKINNPLKLKTGDVLKIPEVF